MLHLSTIWRILCDNWLRWHARSVSAGTTIAVRIGETLRTASSYRSIARGAGSIRHTGRLGDEQRAVAQLVEQRSPKPQVGGSSPSCPAFKDWIGRGNYG
jgi:hypothetical protein